MNLRRGVCWLFAILMGGRVLVAQTDDLLARIMTGEQQAQAKFTTACGTVTEIRTSRLMVKPMVLRGKFCAEGTDRFMLAYGAPNAMEMRLNGNYLNIKAAGTKTQVMDIGGDVRRIQSSFGGQNSMEHLKKDFTVTAQENNLDFELRLVPRAETLRRKFNYLVVKLNKRDFLPRSLEVDGKGGVNSVFTFDISSVNIKLPEDTFEVSRTK
ncbi:MAG TPA: outer membrane lipoprotein carrier protein LolA [Acidobacteriaceae bacterium]|nr:outer membrane lipoprotein carrier protein LolA [Acidobacteriaceae bacterium]